MELSKEPAKTVTMRELVIGGYSDQVWQRPAPGHTRLCGALAWCSTRSPMFGVVMIAGTIAVRPIVIKNTEMPATRILEMPVTHIEMPVTHTGVMRETAPGIHAIRDQFAAIDTTATKRASTTASVARAASTRTANGTRGTTCPQAPVGWTRRGAETTASTPDVIPATANDGRWSPSQQSFQMIL
jgi:hypothetical protein